MIDFTKPVETVGGEPVEIITTKGRGDYPVIGYIGEGTYPDRWTDAGFYVRTKEAYVHNLRNVKTKYKGFVNIYHPEDGRPYGGDIYETADDAERKKGVYSFLVAVAVPIEWPE